MSNKPLLAITSLASMFIGLGAGYMIAEKRLVRQFEERLEIETEAMRTFYTATDVKKYATPEAAVQALIPEEERVSGSLETSAVTKTDRVEYHKIVKSYANGKEMIDPEEQHSMIAEYGEEEEVVQFNNVHNPSQTEHKNIYVISDDEFIENANDFIQSTLTYYVLDNVVTDEREDKIDDFVHTLGNEFKDMFGVKSEDPNTVHVRNEHLSLEFEICRNPKSYSEEVLGMTWEPPIERPSDRIQRGG